MTRQQRLGIVFLAAGLYFEIIYRNPWPEQEPLGFAFIIAAVSLVVGTSLLLADEQ